MRSTLRIDQHGRAGFHNWRCGINSGRRFWFWLTRPFGLAYDNLRAVQIVKADGQIAEANVSLNEDLFRALRGGGGNFGVVTRFVFGLHPLKTVQAGMLLCPIEATREVANANSVSCIHSWLARGHVRRSGAGSAF